MRNCGRGRDRESIREMNVAASCRGIVARHRQAVTAYLA
jgi:hypothetical protein